ncbi:MAG: hypothetical protein ACRDJW_15955 [Thermomicrobiales bacterium]
MARYLVIHSPVDVEDQTVRRPTAMIDLARKHGVEASSPRWLRTWSPDLHDDRIFTLWDARDADEITSALRAFGFLDHMEAHALRVEEWGPDDVIAAADDASNNGA